MEIKEGQATTGGPGYSRRRGMCRSRRWRRSRDRRPCSAAGSRSLTRRASRWSKTVKRRARPVPAGAEPRPQTKAKAKEEPRPRRAAPKAKRPRRRARGRPRRRPPRSGRRATGRRSSSTSLGRAAQHARIEMGSPDRQVTGPAPGLEGLPRGLHCFTRGAFLSDEGQRRGRAFRERSRPGRSGPWRQVEAWSRTGEHGCRRDAGVPGGPPVGFAKGAVMRAGGEPDVSWRWSSG